MFLYYKKNSETVVKKLQLATISDFSSILLYRGYGSVGSATYSGEYISSYISGNFPGYIAPTESISYNNTSILNYMSTTYTSASTTENTLADLYKSHFESLGVQATIFNFSEIADEDIFYICDRSGQNTNVFIQFSVGSNGYYISWHVTGYSGVVTLEMTSNQSSTGSFFLFTDDNYAWGFCSAGNLSDTSNRFNRYVSAYGALSYTSYPNVSPFLWYLYNYDLIPGASGADPIDSDSDNSIGGLGDYDFSNFDIDPSSDIPSASPAITAGLVNPYYVTSSEIASLGNFLWSNSFFDNIAKTFSNPMDCIISLSSFPVSSSLMSLGSSESVRVGNTSSSSTGTRLISEFITINCGSVSVPEAWGSYLDYAQTKLYIYIPYLGIEELPLCECMGGSVACELRVNLLTGVLVACVTLTSGSYVTGSARKQPIYFSTTCKSDIPVSGATTGALAGAFQLLGGATSAIAGVATGVAPLAISGLASAAQGVATMQSQNSQISGAVGAAGGQMAHKIPFLIFDRPVQSVPANLSKIAGYQSNSGTTLSKCSGYVICDTINLDGLALTRSELEEVEQICTSGVYIS